MVGGGGWLVAGRAMVDRATEKMSKLKNKDCEL
jgi:hypothetical protein